MHDVARAAGVSHQTVSRVLNASPSVRPATRERVLVAIAQLGYRRNSAARALVTSRSGTIGLLTLSTNLYGPVSTLISVEEAARAAGLFISVASVRGYDPAPVTAALDHFMNQGVEGIIMIAPVRDAVQVAADLAAQVPMVIIASDTVSGPGYQTASVDQEAGARLATRHLLDLGHTAIAHIGGPAGWLDAEARRRGWRHELSLAGAGPGQVMLGDWTAGSGFTIGQQLLAAPLPTAVFCANDLMALGVVRAFTEAGLSVPSDLSVVGFDDIDGVGFALPPLTTVRQDFAALGAACVQLLIAQLDGAESASRTVLTPELIVRASTTEPVHRASPRTAGRFDARIV